MDGEAGQTGSGEPQLQDEAEAHRPSQGDRWSEEVAGAVQAEGVAEPFQRLDDVWVVADEDGSSAVK